MKNNKLKFYIKERYNPQLGTYFTDCGQMTKAAARAAEKTVYGNNTMHAYNTAAELQIALDYFNKK